MTNLGGSWDNFVGAMTTLLNGGVILQWQGFLSASYPDRSASQLDSFWARVDARSLNLKRLIY
jgi:hypothetical protein